MAIENPFNRVVRAKTQNDKNRLRPEHGITYTTPDADTSGIDNTNNATVNNNMVGARDYLNNKYSPMYGLKDSDIGFNNGMVTVKGIDAFKPSKVENGRSFADSNLIDSAMNRIAVQSNLGIPEGYVRGRDYINDIGKNYGIEDSQIGYRQNPNTGMNDVMIGGEVIGSGYINPSEGRTYMNKNDITTGLEGYAKSRGLQDIRQLEKPPEQYNNPVMNDKLNALLDKVLNQPKFEYNVENDPKFQALKGQYENQGKSAFNNAVGSMSAMTGGRLNSWASSSASQAQNSYNEKLMGLVPEMYQNAYNEYQNDYNRDLSNVNAVMGVDNRDYSRFRDTVGDNQNLRNYTQSKMMGDKTFNEGVRQNDRSFGESVRQYDTGRTDRNTQFDKNYNEGVRQYDTGRTDRNNQFDKTFDETVRNRISNDKLQQQQIGISAGNLSLAREKMNKEYDPNGLDYKYKQAQIDSMSQKVAPESPMIASAFNDIASSGKSLNDWLKIPIDPNNPNVTKGSSLTTEEIQKLVELISKSEGGY